MFLFLIIGSTQCSHMNLNSLQCLNITAFKRQSFNVLDLHDTERNILESEDWDKMFYGQCIAENILAPQWILDNDTANNINPRHRYNILYRIGGAASKTLQLTNTCDCIIYDPLQHKTSNDQIV